MSESTAVPLQFLIKRTQAVEAEQEGTKPVFKSTLLPADRSSDRNGTESRPSTGQKAGYSLATRNTSNMTQLAKARKEQSDAHVLGLAEALGLRKETSSVLGAGEQSEKTYKRVTRLHAEAVREFSFHYYKPFRPYDN